MRYTKAVLCVLALLLCALPFCGALADGTAIAGRSTGEAVFYAYPQTGVTLTFTQEKGTVISTGGIRSTVYGGYDISWYPTTQPYAAQTTALTGRSVSIQLTRGIAYTVRVTPHALDKLKSRDAYLGLPGTYERWATPSEWLLTGSAGCLTGYTPYTAVTATPAPTVIPWYYATATPKPTVIPWYFATATPVPTVVPWYFATATPKPTAAPWYFTTSSPVTATIYVFYRLPDGKLISYSTETLAPGAHVITSKLNGSYFTPVSGTYQVVTVSNDGVASPPSVTFYYQYNSSGAMVLPTPAPSPTPTPTPAPVAVPVEIVYKQSDGTLLYRETCTLAEGVHMISYDNRFDIYPWLRFLGPTAYHVVVSPDGSVSASTLTFYFALSDGLSSMPITIADTPSPTPAFNEAATNQEARIGAEKIYPRPQPGKGKNTFNYEAVGQKVTVHSKARSLQNDGSWWVCISANLRCWGQNYVIDHEWIKTTYLNPNSYDFDAVPLDPQYQ